MANTWKEQLHNSLVKKYGNKKGPVLSKKYCDSFPHSYIDDSNVDTAINDIDYLEQLSAQKPLELNFYFLPEENVNALHLRLYQWQQPIPLSDVLPMLENLDLRTNNETPHKITLDNNQIIWISDFIVIYSKGTFEIEKTKELFQEAFTAIYFGLSENDGFNKLILAASLSWRDIIILRTYAKYLRQVGFRFTQPYIEKTLVNNASITKNLIELFFSLHNPQNQAKEKNQTQKIEQQILQALDSVTSLDEDRIIRRMLELIKATLRTNYFQKDKNGKPKDYLAIKLNSRTIPELPLPMPRVL